MMNWSISIHHRESLCCGRIVIGSKSTTLCKPNECIHSIKENTQKPPSIKSRDFEGVFLVFMWIATYSYLFRTQVEKGFEGDSKI